MIEDKRKSIRDAYSSYMRAAKVGEESLQKEKLLSCLNNYYDSWLKERQLTQDKVWRDAISFYAGNHQVRLPDTRSYRVYLRENHTNNVINRMLSIFVQNIPIVRVFPNSTSWEDASRAETTELYGKYFHRTKKVEQKLKKLVKLSAITGNGFAFWQWNPDLNGEVLLDPSESESGDAEIAQYKGDIDLCIDDPFKILVRPGIDELDDMYDFIRTVPTSRAGLEEKYGKIDADPAHGFNAYTSQLRQDEDLVMVKHYYHKPTSWFPEGMYACWAGKTLLKVRPALKSEKVLPLVHLPFDKPPLRFWATASIEQIMDLQEQLDRAASMIVEARNLMARPRVIVSNEAQLPAQSITDRPGEILRFKLAGGKPEFITPNFNFTELANHKADVRNALSQVSGITTASRGEIPTAARTALALQLVLEQDRSQFLPFIKEFHQAILDIYYGIFSLAAENIDEEDPRSIKIEGSSVMTRAFHGGIVPSPLDCYLEDTNPLGWTAGSRIESTLELVGAGLIKDRNQALEMLHLKSTDPAFEFMKIAKQAAQKEIELLNKGEVLDIGPEDDDAVHLEEHVKIVAAFNFRELALPVQEAHLAHIAQHKTRLQQAASQMQAPPQQQNLQSGVQQVKPEQAADELSPALPGQNMDALLTSARAG